MRREGFFRVSEPYFSNLPQGGILPEIVVDPNGQYSGPSEWTTTFYDAYGRLSSQQLPSGKSIKTTYTPGKPITTVDDGYQKVTTTLDARGNIAELNDANGTIKYTYHPTGGLLSSNFEGHVVKVEYDGWGRKVSLNDPSVGDFSYVYDTYGQLLEETGPSGTTSYQYNALGQLTYKSQQGENTQLSTDYTYTSDSQQLSTQTTVDGIYNETHSYGFTYDDYQRPKTRKEENGYARFEQEFTYDALGRVDTEQRSAEYKGSGQNNIIIAHDYATNGMLVGLQENQKDLWRLKTHNARGQATQIILGNNISQNRSYDALGYLEAIDEGTALNLSLKYNKKQGVLTGRTHNGATESFQYDQRNRVTRIQKGLNVHTQKYDSRGRILDNSQLGEYQYSAGKNYVLDSIVLNAAGVKYYTEHAKQTVAYNMDRKAVSVHEVGFGRADFAYNADMQRIHAWYGGEEEALEDRTYEKHYSSLFPAEITKNNETGKTDIVHYIGGDAYTAPMAKINDTMHYLHRDHLGSILAISDSSGAVVEERQFGAWGEVDFFKKNGQEADFSESILPRGFTGHEHFAEITLIHMNGRMYDPLMHRFLSPDNYIQDPYNTQSYDRFGYVWNNPLILTDPSGEIIETAALALQTLKFITAAFNLYSLGNNIFGRGNYSFTFGSNGQPYVGGNVPVNNSTPFSSGIKNVFLSNAPNCPDCFKENFFKLIRGFYKGIFGGQVESHQLSESGDILGSQKINEKIEIQLTHLETYANSLSIIPGFSLAESFSKASEGDALGAATSLGMAALDLGTGGTASTAKTSAKVAARGVSVIGPRSTYREFAKKIGANFLNVTDEAWTMQKNMTFLRGVVKRGDDVIFAGKFNPTKLNSKSVLAKEINYLERHGYKWSDNYSKLIKQ